MFSGQEFFKDPKIYSKLLSLVYFQSETAQKSIKPSGLEEWIHVIHSGDFLDSEKNSPLLLS